MIAELVNLGGVPPAGETPWPLVLLEIERAGRFESRRRLTQMDAVTDGIRAALGGDEGAAAHHREQLVRRAYPVKGSLPEFLPNEAAPPEDEEPEDADG